MQVNGLAGSQNTIDEMQGRLRVRQNAQEDAAEVKKSIQGDTVEISEAGQKKAQAMKDSSHETHGTNNDLQAKDTASNGMAAENVDVEGLKKTLQQKNSEVTNKQAKLDAAKQLAEENPQQQGEVKKLEKQISDLQKEVTKIRQQVHAS